MSQQKNSIFLFIKSELNQLLFISNNLFLNKGVSSLTELKFELNMTFLEIIVSNSIKYQLQVKIIIERRYFIYLFIQIDHKGYVKLYIGNTSKLGLRFETFQYFKGESKGFQYYQ